MVGCFALVVALASACSFDASDLDQRVGCRVDADCLSGVCVDGICLRTAPDDAGAGGTCAAPTNACGGCATLLEAPGDPCGACGVLACAGADQVVCDEPETCSGCDDVVLGDPCGACGTWTCAGGVASCREVPRNACGGCAPLAGSPGVACSACGGAWACDGADRVTCVGGDSNPCGGCDGPSDVVLGEICACPAAAAAARWGCVGDGPVCGDDNDRVSDAVDLGVLDDNALAPVSVDDALQLDDDIDWYTVRGVDRADSDDGLFPAATLQGGGGDLTLCVFWVYDDRRAWDVGCADGVLSTWDDLFGCCAMDTLGGQVSAGLVLSGTPDPRLDFLPGEGNDGGRMYAAVYDATGAASCDTFRLDLSL